MAKDLDWQKAEAEFETFFGGKSFVYAFEDTREAQRTGGSRRIFTKARPSDYLVTAGGQTFFAEVKYTINENVFSFSMIAKDQLGCAMKTLLGGGLYYFFVKSSAMGKWYRIPALLILSTFQHKKSLRWEELEDYEFRPNH